MKLFITVPKIARSESGPTPHKLVNLHQLTAVLEVAKLFINVAKLNPNRHSPDVPSDLSCVRGENFKQTTKK